MVATATQVQFDEVPDLNANWNAISSFAHTLDSYWFNNDTGDVANNLRQSYFETGPSVFATLDTLSLKASLYFEQIRFRHLGGSPEGIYFEYVSELMTALRGRLIDEHFRFRKPAMRFSINRPDGNNIHILSDGIFLFIYNYEDLLPGSGYSEIIKPEKSAMKSLTEFIRNEIDNWENLYETFSSVDGVQWELKLNLAGINKKVSGFNSYPATWERFLSILGSLAGNTSRIIL